MNSEFVMRGSVEMLNAQEYISLLHYNNFWRCYIFTDGLFAL